MPIIDFILHIDHHLLELAQTYGVWLYGILFVIVFCETGLVVTPFLPGDSLLFAAGALAAGGAFDPLLMGGLIVLAAFLGDNVNYWLGRTIGPKVFSSPDSKLFNRKYLEKTEAFYHQYGARAIIMARFLPIFRTFIPFVAGVGRMPYGHYIGYSFVASALWVPGFLGAGYFFGNIPVVKENFVVMVMGIVVISALPAIIAVIRHQIAKRRDSASN
ncbi:Uncharacterized membrane-associated protein [gamma proteobacterium HdN1]|nr:Uncharacterized membrane-associated protein [gamma proteobacterium HdN1]